MKRYIKPTADLVKIKSNTLMIALSGTEKDGEQALGRESFIPVSEDNANALWDE